CALPIFSDLEVHSRPADKSDGTGGSGGSGMTTAGALVLTGTLPKAPSGQQGASFTGERVSVAADLLLDGDQVRIVATGLYSDELSPVPSGPVDDEADSPAVLAMFTCTIDVKELPVGIRPTEVSAMRGHRAVAGRGADVT